MSLSDKTVGEAGSGKDTPLRHLSALLRKHYETWSRLYVEQRVGMFESDG
jgi:hypothetical protein